MLRTALLLLATVAASVMGRAPFAAFHMEQPVGGSVRGTPTGWQQGRYLSCHPVYIVIRYSSNILLLSFTDIHSRYNQL